MTHEAQQPIIDHVPNQAELLALAATEAADPRITESLAYIGVGSVAEVTTVPADALKSSLGYEPVARPSAAQQVARQMGIDRADRSNRAAAGLPPRTPDLR